MLRNEFSASNPQGSNHHAACLRSTTPISTNPSSDLRHTCKSTFQLLSMSNTERSEELRLEIDLENIKLAQKKLDVEQSKQDGELKIELKKLEVELARIEANKELARIKADETSQLLENPCESAWDFKRSIPELGTVLPVVSRLSPTC